MATKTHKLLPPHRKHLPAARPPVARLPVVIHRPAKRRNASSGRQSEVGRNLVQSTLPAIGVGATAGVAALKIAQHFRASPIAVAGITGALGVVGTVFAPKGSMLASASAAATGLGAGLALIDLMQKPTAPAAAQQQAARQANGDGTYVTRDDLNEALRRAMFQQHEDTIGAVRAELRNAAGAFAPQPPQASLPWTPVQEPSPGSWLNAPSLVNDSYAETESRNAGGWQFASEPQAA